MILSLGTAILMSCCSSVKKASLGAGATPGKDYVTNLRPSPAARQYFTQIGNKSPIETLTRSNAGGSKSGVRFVGNDGILIPAGVTIQFYNKGYCMDPKLPAPVSNEEYQLVPTSALIPSQLQGIYQNLVKRAAAGDSTVKSNMQGLVWALRTAGTEGGYAARLSATQKRILDSCSSRPGEFERVHNSGLATSRLVGELWKLADSAVQVDFGGRRWKPSDFSSAGSLNNAINSQLDSLISMGSKLPIQRAGFNYGELEPGIYTDINGAGHLAFNAKIANSTKKDFIFYPCNYAGQVGSGSVLSAVSFAASSSVTQRQRVTMGPITQVNVLDKKETSEPSPIPGEISFNDQSCSDKARQIEMAALAALVYGDSPLAEKIANESGYVSRNMNIQTDFSSAIYVNENNKSVCIVFRGTDNWRDIVDDMMILKSNTINLGKKDAILNLILSRTDIYPRFNKAENWTKTIINAYPGYSINLVGHSLGGSMVQHVMGKLTSKDIKAYTFNSFGLPGKQGRKEDPRITDIVNGNEPVYETLRKSRITGRKIIVDSVLHDHIPTNIVDRGFQHKMSPTLTNMLHASKGCK